jgi:MarR family transcriptional regulator, organic hydroperoxide resistance regulator
LARPAQGSARNSETTRTGGNGQVPRTVSRSALMPDSSDREFRRFVHSLLAFSGRLERVRAQFGAIIGLSGIQYTALISIAHLSRDTSVGVKEVAEHLGLSGSFATLVIGQLTSQGLVDKVANPGDRRRVHLTVTGKGIELLRRLAPVQRQVNDLLFSPLDAKQFKTLLEVFGELMRSSNAAVNLLDYLASDRAQAANGAAEQR